jgi:hypothetical protein
MGFLLAHITGVFACVRVFEARGVFRAAFSRQASSHAHYAPDRLDESQITSAKAESR